MTSSVSTLCFKRLRIPSVDPSILHGRRYNPITIIVSKCCSNRLLALLTLLTYESSNSLQSGQKVAYFPCKDGSLVSFIS